jgi:6-phosphogluconate dehydrogenase
MAIMNKNDFGIIGLGVMGKNLALNIEDKGFKVSVYDYFLDALEKFKKSLSENKKIEIFDNLEKFVLSLNSPKKILLMIKAGAPVDKMIELLLPHLSEGDIIIDGGNSYFKDTIRRYLFLKEKRIHFIGTGISGGEEGALKGPAIMPGGDYFAYKEVEPVFLKISAKIGNEPCCDYIGSDGAGHFVKMVHNGIEYGDMQLISETYFLLKVLAGFSNDELSEIFTEWNKKELNSYLIEITSKILKKKDNETGKYLVDLILDTAEQKGTGKWASQEALDLGVPAPTIAEAVFARFISALKEERVYAAKIFKTKQIKKINLKRNLFVNKVKSALYASKICTYAQGFSIMRYASFEYKWNLNFASIASIWRAGCIIRAKFLEKIKKTFETKNDLQNLLLDNYFKNSLKRLENDWREVVKLAFENSIPVPAFASALFYYDAYKSRFLPANLIQAQRDFFGAHTYKRIDKEGVFHTRWEE